MLGCSTLSLISDGVDVVVLDFQFVTGSSSLLVMLLLFVVVVYKEAETLKGLLKRFLRRDFI